MSHAKFKDILIVFFDIQGTVMAAWAHSGQTVNQQLKNTIQIDVTFYFIILMLGSTCFRNHYACHQELTTIELVTT